MIKVSVICITYNHEKFIKQALDGFVTQKTSFPFEVLIHDDASTDSTIKIIREYQKKYPEIIKPIFEKENQFSKGNVDFINDMLRASQGDYIAMCEGDDFWTDPEKLQRQVDFLEKHPDYGLCFHPVKVFFDGKEKEDSIFPDKQEVKNFTLENLLRGNYIQTNSVLFRRQNYDRIPPDLIPGDYYLHLYHAQFGKIGFIDRVMAAYRRHPQSLWWEAANNRDKFWEKYGESHLKLYGEVLKLYGDNASYRVLIYERIAEAIHAIAGLASKGDDTLLKKIFEKYPEMVRAFMPIEYKELEAARITIAHGSPQRVIELEAYLQDANEHGLRMQKERDDLRAEITHITSSSTYRVAQKLAKARGIVKKGGAKHA